ncbi:S41 family peptidase [Candidatus Peregrinibacteria bacterium]|nr:S41 family peptidase [Candidatus Peregrinibacteria bacterium]
MASMFLVMVFMIPWCAAFDDIPNDSPYYYSVNYLNQKNIFLKVKKFQPNLPILKAEFIKYLVKLNAPNRPLPLKINLPFTDTSDNAWYAPYVQEAIDLGILDSEKRSLAPYGKLNTIEAITLLFHSKSIPIPRTTPVVLPYRDLPGESAELPLVVRAMELKLVKPKNEKYFGIRNNLTRGEAVQMIYQMELATIDLTISSAGSQEKIDNPQLVKFLQIWNLIHKNYLHSSKIDDAKMINAALKEMTKTLGDTYSVYLNPNENKSLSDDLNGEIEGIGAYLEIQGDKIVIVAPIRGSPAERAGIKAGDIIRSVDSVNTEGMSLPEVASRIKGKRGTEVSLSLLRQEEIVNLKVVRDLITIVSVTLEVNGEIATIKLSQFGKQTMKELADAVEKIVKNIEIKGVVLDLRDNPGGFLDTAIGVLSYFLPPESVAVNIKYPRFDFIQYTNGKGELSRYPLVVLVNKGSASASEITAGAIQDLKIGKLIGEISFGKGTVQEINFFEDNSSLKLTVAEWLTSLGKSINGKGITPDIIVKNTEEDFDAQMERALKELNNMIHGNGM